MKKLLATTALVAMTALPVAAQTATDTTPAPGTAPAATAPATPPAAQDSATTKPMMDASGAFYSAAETDMSAEQFIGKRLYAAEQAVTDASVNEANKDWDDIGEISDIVLSNDGQVRGILVDIGGFLGIGEKTVAVSMDQLTIVPDGDSPDEYFVTFASNKEALDNAPEFMWPGEAKKAEANTNATTPAAATAPATTDMAANDTAKPAADATDADANKVPAGSPVELANVTAEQLQGAPVYDANDKKVGDVSEVVLASDGKITHTVVDIGGFLGIGAKPVALDMGEMTIVAEDGGEKVHLQVTATEEQLEAMPEYNG